MRKRTKVFLALGCTLAVIVAAGAALYWFVIRSDPPPEVTLAGALNSITPAATVATVAPGSPPAGGGAGASPSPATTATAAGLNGTWAPDPSQQNFAGYRVVEELARIGTNTAVGRTPGV